MQRDEPGLLAEANRRSLDYLRRADTLPVFPDMGSQDALHVFNEPLPSRPSDPLETLTLLDEVGSPATTVSNGRRYFGFVSTSKGVKSWRML